MAKSKGPMPEPAATVKMPPPSMRMDMPAGMDMTGMKIGDRVHTQFHGKIKRMEMGKDYDGKMQNMMEVEHEPDSVKVSKGEPGAAAAKHGGFTRKMIDAMSEEKQAKLKKNHPDVWRWYLGGQYK